MNFDTIVIGGGMAGLSSALRCLELGQKTAVIASGQSALHFSSGSIDLLSHLPKGEQVDDPLAALANYPSDYPTHPYAKLGTEKITQAIDWYQSTLTKLGVPLLNQENEQNHLHVTALGTFKASWLSQPFVYQFPMNLEAHQVQKMVLLSIDGFRDLQPKLTEDNLKQLKAFHQLEIDVVTLSTASFSNMRRNSCELRSIDLSRLFARKEQTKELIDFIKANSKPGDLVVLPAIFEGIVGLETLKQIEQEAKVVLSELPTMPPSLMGIRLEETMRRAFIRQGGTLLTGDHVLSGEFITNIQGKKHLRAIFTRNHLDMPLCAKNFILASGSFFSNGLVADLHTVKEPIFGFTVKQKESRKEWYSERFFDKKSHPFLGMGLETDANNRPYKDEQLIQNVYCAGAILSGYNPVAEGCGGGVAISTGFAAAEKTQEKQ